MEHPTLYCIKKLATCTALFCQSKNVDSDNLVHGFFKHKLFIQLIIKDINEQSSIFWYYSPYTRPDSIFVDDIVHLVILCRHFV